MSADAEPRLQLDGLTPANNDDDERQPASAPPAPVSRRKSAALHRRRPSGPGTTLPASHFSKPIEMPPDAALPKVEIEIETRKLSDGASVITTSPTGHTTPTQSPTTASPTANVNTVTAAVAGGGGGGGGGGANALKKQITKVVPTFRGHRKKVKDGEVVFKGHRNWEIVLSIQFGLRYTSDLLDDNHSNQPTPRDYEESLAFDFNPVDETRSVFEVNSFAKWVHPAPFVYRLVRRRFGINEDDFIEATCSKSRVRELPTPGKSGALFYITDDENYFMKTIQHTEEKMLISMLPSYFEHITNNPNTLLTKFLAHFNVHTRRDRHIRMVVMASIFNERIFIDRKYDLKGSTFKRTASPDQQDKNVNITLKDQDFSNAIYFRPEIRDQILQQLDRDTTYLESHNVMDYSLLLGLSYMIPSENAGFKESFGPREENAPYFVGYQIDNDGNKSGVRICMGIIDFLQRFRFRKKMEYGCRVLQSCSASAASVAPPSLYRERFLNSLKSKFREDPNLDVATLSSTVNLASDHVPVPIVNSNTQTAKTEEE